MVCSECGRNFRRITRPSGEVVRRCADKVENGKRATCTNTVAVSDGEIQEIICEQLGLAIFDETAVGDAIGAIEIGREGIVLQTKRSLDIGAIP